MISKIQKMYPGFLIFVKKEKKLYDINNNPIQDDMLLNYNNYIIIINDSYEVHKKTRP